jgi:hypothetical protein
MGSGGMIYIPSFMKIVMGVQAILWFCLRNLKGCSAGITDWRSCSFLTSVSKYFKNTTNPSSLDYVGKLCFCVGITQMPHLSLGFIFC